MRGSHWVDYDSYELLTTREREILQLLAEGKANKEVAAILRRSLDKQFSIGYVDNVEGGRGSILREALANAIKHGNRNDQSKHVFVEFATTPPPERLRSYIHPRCGPDRLHPLPSRPSAARDRRGCRTWPWTPSDRARRSSRRG